MLTNGFSAAGAVFILLYSGRMWTVRTFNGSLPEGVSHWKMELGLLGSGTPGLNTDFKQLYRHGSRGSSTFIPRSFCFEIGSGGSCAFVSCSDFLSCVFY
ncbi:unnamed protein product, partial [Coregonus sp. 'balchen']